MNKMKKIYYKYNVFSCLLDSFLFGYLFVRFGKEVTIITFILLGNYVLKTIYYIDHNIIEREKNEKNKV